MRKEYLRDAVNDRFEAIFDGHVARTIYKIVLIQAFFYFTWGVLKAVLRTL